MNKIKVIHIITMLEMGGAQGNTLFTVQNLNRGNFDVGLICGTGGIMDEKARAIPNLNLIFVPCLVRPVNPWKDFTCLIQLVKILKKEKPQIVHTHSSKAGILGRVAAWLAGVPVVIHSIHGFGFNPYQKFFVRWLFVALEKWIAPITRTLIAVSSENISEGLSLGIGKKDQYFLIRSGVDIADIKRRAASADKVKLKGGLNIPEGAKVVLTVGPFKLQKNPVGFVQMAGKVSKECPEAVFVMSGDGELRPAIEAEIRALGLEKNFRLIGWRKDVPELLSVADVFVLTSLWEGLPRAGVESLIAGVPVVGTSVNGIPEIVKDGENGYVLSPDDIGGIAEKVCAILKDEHLAKELRENAPNAIDGSFDIHQMVLRQEALYQELIRKTPF